MLSIYLFSALLPLIYITEEYQVEKFSSPQFHFNSAAQSLISVSRVNPHHPLNGTKTIMRMKLQRRDKAAHLPCTAGSCLSHYRASQTRAGQKGAISPAFYTQARCGWIHLLLSFSIFLQATADMMDKSLSSIVNKGGWL